MEQLPRVGVKETIMGPTTYIFRGGVGTMIVRAADLPDCFWVQHCSESLSLAHSSSLWAWMSASRILLTLADDYGRPLWVWVS
jgi:hypothetical protein